MALFYVFLTGKKGRPYAVTMPNSRSEVGAAVRPSFSFVASPSLTLPALCAEAQG